MKTGNSGRFIPSPAIVPSRSPQAMDLPLEDHLTADFQSLELERRTVALAPLTGRQTVSN